MLRTTNVARFTPKQTMPRELRHTLTEPSSQGVVCKARSVLSNTLDMAKATGHKSWSAKGCTKRNRFDTKRPNDEFNKPRSQSWIGAAHAGGSMHYHLRSKQEILSIDRRQVVAQTGRRPSAQISHREKRTSLGLRRLCGDLLGHLVAGVRGDAEANALVAPMVDCVILCQHGLPPDEELRPNGLRQGDGHDRRTACIQDDIVHAPNIRTLTLSRAFGNCCVCHRHRSGTAVIAQGGRVGSIRTRGGKLCTSKLFPFLILQQQGWPRIVAGKQRDGHAPIKLEMDRQALGVAAIHTALGGKRRVLQVVLQVGPQLVSKINRHSQQRGAGVDHRAASTVFTKVDDTVADAQVLDLDHPMPLFRHDHRCPTQAAAHTCRRVPAERDLANFLIAFREEDAEACLLQVLLSGQHAEHAELWRDRQAVQAQANDAIEGEGVERLVRHLRCCDDPHLHAM
mmetsp:Transcript_59710/g.151534  ORF Transcript_59710/g.151534 Transcript_59710/m.151534 type:complete len:454 (+) Transcript_59710:55-1416(+)